MLRIRLRLVVLLALGSTVLGSGWALARVAVQPSGQSGPIHGALYRKTFSPSDRFEMRISKDGQHAHVVGQFVYTDPGCPTQPSGNEYLTPQNAPRVSIAGDGNFFGTRRNGIYRDTISGVFQGASAATKFKETIPSCKGDKPQVFKFTMTAKK